MDSIVGVCLCILVVAIATVHHAEACSCAIQHPQKAFCNSDFALKVQILESELLFPEESNNNTESDTAQSQTDAIDMRYSVHIIKAFKSSPVHNMTDNSTFDHIYTPASSSMCGVNLDVGRKYIITGYVATSGEARTDLCSAVAPWDTLSTQQRKGYSYKYAKGCDCQVGYCFQPKCHKKANKNECLWNFRADVGGCHERHAVCRQSDTGRCAWRKPGEFAMCMERSQH